MIICHSHRFIFIKTRKTAGTSVEIALSRLCSPGDIVTPLKAKQGEEDLRKQEGGYGPTGHNKPLFAHKRPKEWYRLLSRGQRASYKHHMRASEIKALVGSKVWSNYLKITVERNPWDRILSRYWWEKHLWEKKHESTFPEISDFLHWMAKHKPHWLTNWKHYSIDNEIAVDCMLFYESLSSDLVSLAHLLGVDDAKLALPRKPAKGGFRKDTRSYSEVLSNTDRMIIEQYCRREIKELGYTFFSKDQNEV